MAIYYTQRDALAEGWYDVVTATTEFLGDLSAELFVERRVFEDGRRLGSVIVAINDVASDESRAIVLTADEAQAIAEALTDTVPADRWT